MALLCIIHGAAYDARDAQMLVADAFARVRAAGYNVAADMGLAAARGVVVRCC